MVVVHSSLAYWDSGFRPAQKLTGRAKKRFVYNRRFVSEDPACFQPGVSVLYMVQGWISASGLRSGCITSVAWEQSLPSLLPLRRVTLCDLGRSWL